MEKQVVAGCFLVCVFVGGCVEYKDPTPEELRIAEHLDITRVSGKVSARNVQYYAGDQNHSKEFQGTPYYTVTITAVESNGRFFDSIFRGVSVEIFDLLPVGTKLPLDRVLTRQELAKINGRVVMMQADLKEKAFFVLIYDYDKYSIYRVSPEVFVEDLDIGTQLPMKAKIGSGAQAP